MKNCYQSLEMIFKIKLSFHFQLLITKQLLSMLERNQRNQIIINIFCTRKWMIKGQNSTEIQHCQLPKSNGLYTANTAKLNYQYLTASLSVHQFFKFWFWFEILNFSPSESAHTSEITLFLTQLEALVFKNNLHKEQT